MTVRSQLTDHPFKPDSLTDLEEVFFYFTVEYFTLNALAQTLGSSSCLEVIFHPLQQKNMSINLEKKNVYISLARPAVVN